MATRSEKNRRRQHRKEKKRKHGHDTGSHFTPAGDMVIFNPPGEVKMSEVLMEFIEPEWNTCADEEAMHKLLTLGVAAWNAALMPPDKRPALLDDLAATFPSELRSTFRMVIDPLIRRKDQDFPHLQRPILSYELTWLPSGEPYLSVISGLV